MVESLNLTLSQMQQSAISAYASGNLVEAEKLCKKIIATKHDFLDALHLLAVVQSRLGKNKDALTSYDRALALRPSDEKILTSRGITLQELGRLDEALVSHDRALAVNPNNAEALNNRGTALQYLKRFDEALASFNRALKQKPKYVDAHFNRGIALQSLLRYDEALASFDCVLSLTPGDPEALNNRGNILHIFKRFEEALVSFDRAIALCPNHYKVWSNRGIILKELRRFDESLASFDRALELQPNYSYALSNRANTLQEMHRFGEALVYYDRALALQPDYVDALFNRGTSLSAMGKFQEALTSFERAITLQPNHPYAYSDAADCAAKTCDWDRYNRFSAELRTQTLEQKSIVSPFVLLNYSGDESLHLMAAQRYSRHHFGKASETFGRSRWRNDRIRLAYLSPDFRAHPVARSIVELFEHHDRTRFEVIGLSFGPDDGSELRKRIAAAFDQFHDVRIESDRDIAKRLHDLRVDIAIDLCGYTTYSRPAIFAHRPSPIQTSYFGYSATMGSDFIDYIIGDAIVLPFECQTHYSERIVHLPHCFLPNDRQRTIAASAPTRTEAGLPEHGFVICCFNNSWKITREIFDIWMQLLKEIDDSVLWLLNTNDVAVRNLRHEAEVRGINVNRLVFAPRVRVEDHLARHRLADLFIDTLPYNAHTTAAEALWSGLPVLTCKGDAFVGRVAASLLHAIDLTELITSNLEEYKGLALRLAHDSTALAEIKSKLARNRDTHPLFNSSYLARHIESAYTTMWEMWQHNEKPRSFSVQPL